MLDLATMTNLTLCILAAGMGSRYGGLKQIDGFGPNNEALIEYAIYDAIQAGFSKVVIVIKKDIEQAFKDKFQHTFLDQIKIEFAYQDMDISSYGHETPADRVKPRGTAHAVMSAKPYIDGPFVLISADDYYGPHMMQIVVDHMDHIPPLGGFVICYQLPDTVSDFGSVNRGVCHVLDNKLVSIQEHLSISRKEDGVLSDKNGIALPEDTLVTMLSYCLQKDFFDAAEPLFQAFLDAKPGPSDEFFLPTVIDDMMRHRGAEFEVLINHDRRAGVTNPDDKPFVQQHLQNLVDQGTYPQHLWSA